MAKKKSNRTPSVKTSWQRIETWLESNAPSYASALGKPAIEKDLQSLFDKIDFVFPKSFVESCKVHSSGKSECDFIPDRFGTYFLLQLKDIPREWKTLNDLKRLGDFDDSDPESGPGVAKDWWNENWVPFASNGGGDLLCFDFAPAKGGRKCQVVKFLHDAPERRVISPSFATWLADTAAAVVRGELLDLIDP